MELEPYVPGRRFAVCARTWRLLDAFDGFPSGACLGREPSPARAPLRRFGETGVDGVSIHERLLDARVMADLRSVAGLVLTWPVNVPVRARELLHMGVDGLIS